MLGSMMRSILPATLAVAAGMAPIQMASAQDQVDATRGPRFLVAAASNPSHTTPLDVSRVPALRRRITLELQDATLKEALAAIARKAELNLAYSGDVVPLQHRVSLQAHEITAAAALMDVLMDANADVVFLSDNRAVLRKRTNPAPPPGGMLLGRVTDSTTGMPLTGADILVSGASGLRGMYWKATTDTAGFYRFASIDTGTYALTARRLGYAKQSRRVTVREGITDTINFALAPAAAHLDELVTTATGRQRRRDLGNAITTINADSVMQHAPIRSLTDLLANRVPGLTVQHTSGAPGDPAKLRFRGLGSVFGSNDPVVVVDGVRVYSAQSANRSGNLTNSALTALSGPLSTRGQTVTAAAAPSPLDQIDPNIIEKIEVFKGPSAATLYGADAANGVIVITTKKGKAGPTLWNASLGQSRTETPGTYPTGYYSWGHNLLNGRSLFCTLADPRCQQDSLVQFQALNDPSLTLLGHGNRTDASMTVSGGVQALTYSITGSYSNELGLLRLPDYEVERFRALFNQGAPDWMRRPHQYSTWSVASSLTARLGATADVTLSTSLSRSEQRRTSLEEQVAPLAGTYVDTLNAIYYQSGGPLTGSEPGLGGDLYHLVSASSILKGYYTRRRASTITFTSGLNANWRARSWFNVVGQAGLNVVPRRDDAALPRGLASPTDSGFAALATGRSLVSTFNVQGTLQKPLKWGFNFQTSVGANLTTTNTSDLSASSSSVRAGATTITGGSGFVASEQGSNTSVYGWYVEPRVSGQRISLSTGLRLDGGSAYGTRFTSTSGGLGLLGLPKLNGSWVISEEPWFPFHALIQSLRLRGAYGLAQVQPSPTQRLRLYGSSDQSDTLLELTSLGNSELRPERKREFEGGFDADFFDSRVSLELTGYNQLQIDALMPTAVPPSVNGGGTRWFNIGNVRNTGLELTLSLTPVRSSALTWGTQLNYTSSNNKLVKLGRGVTPNPQQGWVEGYPVGGRWAKPILGYADQNGDGRLDFSEIQVGDSLVFMGRLEPNRLTGLSTNIVLFGGTLGLTAGFSYMTGGMQIDQTAKTNWVLARALVDPTVPLSEQAAVLASASGNSGSLTDYGVMQDVSTFRFNNISLNYRVPASVVHRLGAQQLSVAVQGDNLALHSTYKGKDPDVNAWSPGENIVDTGQLPQPRTWRLALYLQY